VTQDQVLLLCWLLSLISRIPRIVERWTSPFVNGPGWFFAVEVRPEFLQNGGRTILTRYRQRLFLPWVVELPVCAVLYLTGYKVSIMIVVIVMTLLTRLNYYADRQWAERKARRFAVSGANSPIAGVTLSLRPRTLLAYTNPWLEIPIVLAAGGSLLWLIYRYTVLGNWEALRGPLNVTLVCFYLQIGLLLIKRGFVRARSAAPSDNSAQYMAWRESLRRLSTAGCDYTRLVFACFPVTVDLASVTDHWQGSASQTGTFIFISLLTPFLLWHEWRIRQQHLKVARATKPTGFLVLPDTVKADGFVCFKPSLPILLLKGPRGYALNLASAPAKTVGLYLAGCAVLLICLSR
jgi:hypothetical protein